MTAVGEALAERLRRVAASRVAASRVRRIARRRIARRRIARRRITARSASRIVGAKRANPISRFARLPIFL
jgi:hypothetical protein